MQAQNVSQVIRIGCSGWVYKHWRGLFYPEGLPQKRWFERYAETFDTVEINASFYRVPLESTFEGWREKAPPGAPRGVIGVDELVRLDPDDGQRKP